MIDNKIFFSDISANINISFADLIKDLKSIKLYHKFCKQPSFYQYFLRIILAAICDRQIVLLDSDFSDAEIKNMAGVGKDEINAAENIIIPAFNSIDDVLHRIKLAENFEIVLFTSGTTGLPKKVSHTYSSIARHVKCSEKHSDDIWGFAYNPTHMAGLQVFFQALMNKNTIVRLFGLDRNDILKSIKDKKITHISATPTFYRLLLPLNEKLECVKNLTSGGERFDEKTLTSLKNSFCNAKITNVYASTEAGTLFASDGNSFTLKESIKPFVKIENGELLLHKSILGKSENFTGDWYNTGDLVEIISEDPLAFRFLSRKNEMINVGGYKVNPEEVEDNLRSISGIANARVYGKKNNILGNIVCAEIILKDPSLGEKFIRGELKKSLQEFKIPRIMKFVENIEFTKTGKTARK